MGPLLQSATNLSAIYERFESIQYRRVPLLDQSISTVPLTREWVWHATLSPIGWHPDDEAITERTKPITKRDTRRSTEDVNELRRQRDDPRSPFNVEILATPWLHTISLKFIAEFYTINTFSRSRSSLATFSYLFIFLLFILCIRFAKN